MGSKWEADIEDALRRKGSIVDLPRLSALKYALAIVDKRKAVLAKQQNNAKLVMDQLDEITRTYMSFVSNTRKTGAGEIILTLRKNTSTVVTVVCKDEIFTLHSKPMDFEEVVVKIGEAVAEYL